MDLQISVDSQSLWEWSKIFRLLHANWLSQCLALSLGWSYTGSLFWPIFLFGFDFAWVEGGTAYCVLVVPEIPHPSQNCAFEVYLFVFWGIIRFLSVSDLLLWRYFFLVWTKLVNYWISSYWRTYRRYSYSCYCPMSQIISIIMEMDGFQTKKS
jgi:hypothetical protein